MRSDTRKKQPQGADAEFLQGGGELGALIRAKAWSQTPIGPPETWPQSLRTTVSLCLASNFPINIVWGPEHTQIYNDGYRDCCGEAHPRALGENYRVTWASAWPAIGEPFERALAGNTSYLENQRMFLNRNGYLEETFFTFSTSPIRDESGGIGGLFHPVTETTATMLSERRTRALRDLGTALGLACDEADVARKAVAVLSRFDWDLPFLLFYRFDPECKDYRLAAHHGLRAEACAAPVQLAVDARHPWPFAEALEASGIVEVDHLAPILRREACGPYPEAPSRAFVLPVSVPGAGPAPAVVVAGASSRLPMTDAYRSFYELLNVTVSVALAAVRAREDERRRAEALAELDRAKTTFFSNVSHEFRTPLTLILGPVADLLADGSAEWSPSNKGQLEIVHRNSLRLLKLVNTLLDFARIEAGRARANYQATDLAVFTADLASSFRSACERAGLTLDVACPPLPDVVYVDRDMWEKIVLNLLSNAFKFTLDGGITVVLDAREGCARLTVRDSGVGIPAEELPRMFDRFHRVKQTRGRTHEGTGIGLALVQELARLHGGQVRVESVLGEGSTFVVAIPFGCSHLDASSIGADTGLSSTSTGPLAFVEEALRWLPAASTDAGGVSEAAPLDVLVPAPGAAVPGAARARILWADDNADMREYVSKLLQTRFVVEAVADGAAALQSARRDPPDLVLSDIMMPRLHGVDLLRELRADPATREVPIILLSARAGEESRIEGMAAGADDYLIKPFSARELLARVETHVKMARVRRTANEALRLRSEQFETLLNRAPLGVCLLDGDLRVCEINPVARPVFEVLPGDVLGQRFEEVIRVLWEQDDAEALMRLVRHTLDTGQPYVSAERAQLRADGSVTEYFEWRIERIALRDGGQGVVCYFRDISNQVHIREALREADKAKDNFLAVVSHELKNPLNLIHLQIDLLSRLPEARTQPALSDTAATLRRTVDRLSHLVDDLLDLALVKTNKLSLTPTVFDLGPSVAAIVAAVEHEAKAKCIQISAEIDPPVLVRADPDRLEQVTWNLLSNALKFTPPGGRITVALRRQGTEAVLEVRDSGRGIDPEVLPRIFDIFVQEDSSTTRDKGGLGIGLALVQQIAALHGGRAEADSHGKGHGAAFRVFLPLATVAAAGPLGEPRSDTKRLLLVQDDPETAKVLQQLLELEGYVVDTACDGLQGLEKASGAVSYDLIISDLGMPKMDGWGLIQSLRSNPRTASIPAVALAPFSRDRGAEGMLAAGFDGVVPKPVKLDVLLSAATKALRKLHQDG
ncbi:ATP-binding protein [Aquabacterium sp. A7-Y]|uniref:ATP-binding protein n=1 Tax=Aquabacterium sp. A7-Y TaxID=1349605 RepID=UPI00223E27E0|nr:ATP-binding protein [Aquabacterium sp. A7-Y]MCW7539452.1 ATP-binding protein [Aquabacterium sp. A7-Y]